MFRGGKLETSGKSRYRGCLCKFHVSKEKNINQFTAMLDKHDPMRSDETIISCKAETVNKNLVELETFLDCGAFYNFMTQKLAQRLNLKIKKLNSKMRIHGYQGNKGPNEYIEEYAQFPLIIEEHYEMIRCYLIKSCGRHQIILGHRWFRVHDFTLKLGQGTITFDSAYCTSSCNSGGEIVIVNALKSPEALKKYAKSGIIHSGSIDKDSTAPLSLNEKIRLKSLKNGINTTYTNFDKLKSDVDVKLCSTRAIETYSKRKSKKGEALCGIFVRDMRPDIIIKNLNLNKISKEDFSIFMKDKVDINFRDKLPMIYEAWKDVFSRNLADNLPNHSEGDHKIQILDGGKLPNHKPRQFSQIELEVARKYVDDMLSKGHIIPSDSAATSPLLIVRKPGGGLRICVDYRDLNEITIKDRYPIPLIQETLAHLAKAKIFTKLDVIAAFNRIRVRSEDEWLTAFTTRWGSYQYKVMPFGLCNAPSTFQRYINNALHDYLDKFCSAYLDDILIWSENIEEHTEHVKKVLQKMREKKLYADLSKCEFHVNEVRFLGMIITTDGIKMDPLKIEAIKNWELPTTVTGVLGFLGLTGYYRRFIKNYSFIALPLTQSTKGKPHTKGKITKIEISKDFIEAFENLKAAFQDNIVLRIFDPDLPTRVKCDSSGWACGGVVEQHAKNNKWYPTAFFSKKHTPAESNYDIYDQELMAIVKAFEEFRPELMSINPETPIHVISDHKNLQTFMKSKMLSRRQARWALFLSQFNFKIIYGPGKDNLVADSLSRRKQDLPVDSNDERLTINNQILLKKHNISKGMADIENDSTVNILAIGSENDTTNLLDDPTIDNFKLCLSEIGDQDEDEAVTRQKNTDEDEPTPNEDLSTEDLIKHSYENDSVTKEIFEILSNDSIRRMPGHLIKSGNRFSLGDCQIKGYIDLGIDNRRLYVNNLLYIPDDDVLKRRLYSEYHDHPISGHSGYKSTYFAIQKNYYWPYMAREIDRFCKNCSTCRRTKYSRDKKHGFLRPLPIPISRWQHLSIDYIVQLPICIRNGASFHNIVVICDRLTKRRHFVPSETLGSKELARIFLPIFAQHGLPQSIVSDRGSNFISKFWRRICKRLGISLKFSTAFHPETDGQTERANQSLEEYLRKYVNYNQDDWIDWLHLAEFQANNTVNATTGMSPFFADTGFHPRTGFEIQDPPQKGLSTNAIQSILNADSIVDHMQNITEQLRINALWMQNQQVENSNQHRSDAPLFKVGDLVYVDTRNWRTERPTKKLDDKYAGPWKVTRIVPGSKAIEVDLPSDLKNDGVFNVFHPNLLRLYIPNPVPLQESSEPKVVKLLPNNEFDEKNNEFLVDDVVDCKKINNKWKYRVKWTGNPRYEWEDKENWINHYDAWLFHWKYPKKPKPPDQRIPKGWVPLKEDREIIQNIGYIGE